MRADFLVLKDILSKELQQQKCPLVSKHSGVKAQNPQIDSSIPELGHPHLAEAPESTVSVSSSEAHAQSAPGGRDNNLLQ